MDLPFFIPNHSWFTEYFCSIENLQPPQIFSNLKSSTISPSVDSLSDEFDLPLSEVLQPTHATLPTQFPPLGFPMDPTFNVQPNIFDIPASSECFVPCQMAQPVGEGTESSPKKTAWLKKSSKTLTRRASKKSSEPTNRPFQCDHCERAFTRKHDLQRHVRLHTGDKPYHCIVCNRGFARVDSRQRHYRVEENCRKILEAFDSLNQKIPITTKFPVSSFESQRRLSQ